MWSQIANNPAFSDLQVALYLLGAFGWCASYILVIRKIIKEKWVEFPAFVIAGNIAWELLWGFFLDLSFGGMFLQYVWRGGFLMDVFMFYAIFRYGNKQYHMPFIHKNYHLLLVGVFFSFLFMVYFYAKHSYDLAMGFNSGMILNIIHSVGCLLLFLNHPKRRFSFWIGFTRVLATDVFFFAYILLYDIPQYFTITMCVIVAIIDFYYLYAVAKRNRQFNGKQTLAVV